MLNNFIIIILLLILFERSVVYPPPAPPDFKQRFKLLGKKHSNLCCQYVIILFPKMSSIFSDYFLLHLFYSGDIELNPGPNKKHSEIFHKCVRDYPKNLKILHLTCRSLNTKSIELKHLVNDIGFNCIYGFKETWLKTFSILTLFEIQKNCLTCLRNGRGDAKKGEVLMLRTDFEYMNKNCESMWVQFTHLKTRQKLLINLSYCLKKNLLTNSSKT